MHRLDVVVSVCFYIEETSTTYSYCASMYYYNDAATAGAALPLEGRKSAAK